MIEEAADGLVRAWSFSVRRTQSTGPSTVADSFNVADPALCDAQSVADVDNLSKTMIRFLGKSIARAIRQTDPSHWGITRWFRRHVHSRIIRPSFRALGFRISQLLMVDNQQP